LATAPFAHVPVKLGFVPIFVERLVAMSHQIGVRVVTWTVDEPVVMRHLLDAGVDAIISDRPDVLREVLVSRDQWAPMLPAKRGHVAPTCARTVNSSGPTAQRLTQRGDGKRLSHVPDSGRGGSGAEVGRPT
jgi:hypothetical protein